MKRAYPIISVALVLISLALANTAMASQEAYNDCVKFYGLSSSDPKFPEVKKTCNDVTNTMEEWKQLKDALCAGTPTAPECAEFLN
jgi:hypothetical protein